MPKKDPYGQLCPVALTLDIVGDRWTLLIARELFCGPLKFGEIRGGLERISSDVLTNRLKKLVEEDVVHHQVDGQYALTAKGRRLLPMLQEMAIWGAGLLAPEGEQIKVRYLLHLLALGPAALTNHPVSSTELRTSTLRRWITTNEHGLRVSTAGTAQPDTIVEVEDAVLESIAHGEQTWSEAVLAGRLHQSGATSPVQGILDGMIPMMQAAIDQGQRCAS